MKNCSFSVHFGNANAARLVADVGHQSHVAGTLDGNRQLTLMESAGTGHTAGNDLGALAHVLAQAGQILVIDVLDAVNAEGANLLAAMLKPFC